MDQWSDSIQGSFLCGESKHLEEEKNVTHVRTKDSYWGTELLTSDIFINSQGEWTRSPSFQNWEELQMSYVKRSTLELTLISWAMLGCKKQSGNSTSNKLEGNLPWCSAQPHGNQWMLYGIFILVESKSPCVNGVLVCTERVNEVMKLGHTHTILSFIQRSILCSILGRHTS